MLCAGSQVLHVFVFIWGNRIWWKSPGPEGRGLMSGVENTVMDDLIYLCVWNTGHFLPKGWTSWPSGRLLSLFLFLSRSTQFLGPIVLVHTSGRSACSIYNVMSLFLSHREIKLSLLHTYHRAANTLISAHAKLTPPILSYTTSSVPRGSAQSQQISLKGIPPLLPNMERLTVGL